MRTPALALLALVALILTACGAEQGSDGMTVKIPHLIAYAGTDQEQDLGPYIDLDHYWSEELGGYVNIRGNLGFADDRCAGDVLMHDAWVPFQAATDGEIYEKGDQSENELKFVASGDDCLGSGPWPASYVAIDTGTAIPAFLLDVNYKEHLSVEAR